MYNTFFTDIYIFIFLFDTSHRYSASYPKLGKVTVPMFKPETSVSFQIWIQKWARQLISKVRSGKLCRLTLSGAFFGTFS